MHAVYLLGRMGSGKTTISYALRSLGFQRVSAGDVSRALGSIGLTNDGLDPREGAIQRGVECGIASALARGDVVIDGFPRHLNQLHTALTVCGTANGAMFVHIRNRHWLRNLVDRRRVDDAEQEIRTAHLQIPALSGLLSRLCSRTCSARFHVLDYDNASPAATARQLAHLVRRTGGADEQRDHQSVRADPE